MKILDTSTPVVVLRLDHYSSLGIMRSLGRLGIPVYGVHKDKAALALRSRYCQGCFIWDLDKEAASDSLDFLASVARRLGGRAILLPTNDETAIFVAEHQAALSQYYLFPANPLSMIRSLYSKKGLYYLAKKFGVPTPEVIFPKSRVDVINYCDQAAFPVMLKAIDNISVSRRCGKKMVIAKNAKELLANYDLMEDRSNPTLMLQEYIPGGDDTVWMFNGYFDENSDCLIGFTGKKIHQTPVYTGMTSLGICLPNETVRRITIDFMKEIGYHGILDIGYRFDARDGLYKVLDVNPRLGATFRLFVGQNSLDVVRAQYLHLTGQPVPKSDLRIGRKWFVEDLDLISSIHYYRDGLLTVKGWLNGFKGVQEGAWYATDDLMPFLGMCGKFAVKPFRKLFKLFKPVTQAWLPAEHRAGELANGGKAIYAGEKQ